MINADNKMFCECELLDGTVVYAYLTHKQLLTQDEAWNEDRTWAYEDRNGELIEHDVLISDLEVIEAM